MPRTPDEPTSSPGERTSRRLAPLLPALLLLTALAASHPLAAASASTVVYESDFSGNPDPSWGAKALLLTTSPSGERFLGRFGNTDATLAVAAPLPHSSLTLSFDLYIIETWDGQGGPYQSHADEWTLTGPSGATMVHTSFSNCDRESQDYPAPAGYGYSYSATTGAAAVDTLGYDLICYYWEGVADSTYHFQVTVPHSLPHATFTFAAAGLQELEDESWGLDNVRVTAA